MLPRRSTTDEDSMSRNDEDCMTPGIDEDSTSQTDGKLQNLSDEDASAIQQDDCSSKKSVKFYQLGEQPKEHYSASGVKQTLHGVTYQLKLLILFFIRGLKVKSVFRLATEMDIADKFDDLVFTYKNEKNQTVWRFVQAKHKLLDNQKISADDLLTEVEKDKFSLKKYFMSFRKIKNNEYFANSILKDFTLCTNIDIDLDDLNEKQISTKKINEVDEILPVKNNSAFYNIHIDKSHNLYKIFKETSDIDKLAKGLAEFVKSMDKKTKFNLKCDIFKKYHLALAKEAIDIENKVFRSNFIKNINLSTEVQAFRHKCISYFLNVEIVSDNHEQEFQNIWSSFKLKITDAFGKPNKDQTCVLTLPNDPVTDEEIDEFLGKFVLAVNQPNDENLSEIINKEIGEKFNLGNSELLANFVQNAMLDWIKYKGEKRKIEGIFLSEKEGDELYKLLDEKLNAIITTGISVLNKTELQKYGINFNSNSMSLSKFISDKNSQICHMISQDDMLLQSIRLTQTIVSEPSLKNQDSFIFVNATNLLHLQTEIFKAFQCKESHNLLIIICTTDEEKKETNSICNKILQILCENQNKKIIILSKEQSQILTEMEKMNKNITKINERICYDSLTVAAQNKILDNEIEFQGVNISFRLLFGPNCIQNSKNIIDAETLQKIIRNECIIIGHEIPGLGEISHYYIPRIFKQCLSIKNDLLKCGTLHDSYVILGFNDEAYESENLDFCNNMEDAECRLRSVCLENTNVHFLKKEKDILTWKKSQGSLNEFMNFINTENEFAIKESELDVVQCTENSEIVIISDTAGMGKTTVLTSIMQRSKLDHPETWVIRIDLNNCTKVLEIETKQRSFDSKDSESAINFLIDKLLGSNKNTILKSSLEKAILKMFLNISGNVSIFIDAFDEISPDYKDVMLDLIIALKGMAFKKLFITTRPNMKVELQNRLSQIAHSMEPFSESEQMKFLTKYHGDHSINEDDAKQIIHSLSAKISDKNKVLTGIPLHSRMLAELSPEVLNYLDNIHKLYTEFVNKKFDKYIEEKTCIDLSKVSSKQSVEDLREKFMDDHKICALNSIFSIEQLNLMTNKKQQKKLDSVRKKIYSGNEKTGIMINIVDEKPMFIHRTFAEFFVALYLAEMLEDDMSDKGKKFLITEILLKPEYFIIRNFLNGCISNSKILNSYPDAFNDFGQYINSLRLEQVSTYNNKNILHIAAKERNTNIVEFLLQCIEDETEFNNNFVNATTIKGKSPLHYASSAGELEIMKLLIKSNASVNCKDMFNRTVIYMAAGKGHLNILQYIIENHPNVDINDVSNKNYKAASTKFATEWSPLHIACFNSETEIVKYLVKKGANINAVDSLNRKPLDLAVNAGSIDVVTFLEPQKLEPMLHCFTKENNFKGVKQLLEQNVDVNSQIGVWTPLHLAAFGGFKEVATILIKNGADVNHPSIDGFTPLHCAVTNGHLHILELLIENHANRDPKNNSGWTILHAAAQIGHLKLLKYIIEEMKFDVNLCDKIGTTVLLSAAGRGEFHIVKYLIENGANINAVNDIGANAAFVASMANCIKTLKYILSNENYNILNNNDTLLGRLGFSMLHMAVANDNMEIIKHLVEEIHVNINDENVCLSALHVAAFFDHENVINYLVEKGAKVYSHLKITEALSVLDKFLSNSHNTALPEIVDVFIKCHYYLASFVKALTFILPKITPSMVHNCLNYKQNPYLERNLSRIQSMAVSGLRPIISMFNLQRQIANARIFLKNSKPSSQNV